MVFTRQAESKDAADRACRLLAQVKSGVAHLTEKLHSVKTVSRPLTHYCVTSHSSSSSSSATHTHAEAQTGPKE